MQLTSAPIRNAARAVAHDWASIAGAIERLAVAAGAEDGIRKDERLRRAAGAGVLIADGVVVASLAGFEAGGGGGGESRKEGDGEGCELVMHFGW